MKKTNYKIHIIIFILSNAVTISLISANNIDTIGDYITCFILYYIVFLGIYSIIKGTNLKQNVKTCSKCGAVIKSSKKSCNKGDSTLVDTYEKVVYEKSVSTTTHQTEHYKGGYAPKNSCIPNKTSQTVSTTVSQVPINKKFYKYKVKYHCKKCNNLIYVNEEEYDHKL